MSHTEGKWIIEGSTVYQLMHSGWRKGEEQLKNSYYFRVEADKEAPQSAEDVARRLVACWNEHDGLVHDNARLYESLNSEMRARIEAEKERDELVAVLRRQFNADKTLMEMPDECSQLCHEEALLEHIASHKAIEMMLAKYPEAS